MRLYVMITILNSFFMKLIIRGINRNKPFIDLASYSFLKTGFNMRTSNTLELFGISCLSCFVSLANLANV